MNFEIQKPSFAFNKVKVRKETGCVWGKGGGGGGVLWVVLLRLRRGSLCCVILERMGIFFLYSGREQRERQLRMVKLIERKYGNTIPAKWRKKERNKMVVVKYFKAFSKIKGNSTENIHKMHQHTSKRCHTTAKSDLTNRQKKNSNSDGK